MLTSRSLKPVSILLCVEKRDFPDVFTLRTSSRGIILAYPFGPDLITWVLKSWEHFWLWLERHVTMEQWSERHNLAGFEDRRREPWAKECRWFLYARKGKKIDSLHSLLKRGHLYFSPFCPVDTFILALHDMYQTSNLIGVNKFESF